MTLKRTLLTATLVALLSFGVSASSSATIISAFNATDISGFPVGMDVSDGSPYSSFAGPGGPFPRGARYFTESTLDIGGIALNVINPSGGVPYGPGGAASSPGSYAPGTRGTSHYIFWDPREPDSHISQYTFSRPVIGILWSTFGLAATDSSLGLSGVEYGGLFAARGFEDPAPDLFDTVLLSADLRTLRFRSRAGMPGDWFRVVTAVPEPTSALLLGLGLGALGVFGRRRRH